MSSLVQKFRQRWAGFWERRVDPFLVRGAVGCSFLSTVYYLLFSRAFRREQLAVLRGRREQLEGQTAEARSLFMRRNIHALEKGLVMRPRRRVFGVTYLHQTVDDYAFLLKAGLPGYESELVWAHDVLKAYFGTVSDHPVINPEREHFRKLPEPDRPSSSPALIGPTPVPTGKPVISIADLENFIRRRKSVRWFLPREVPRADIDRAVVAAGCAPSACNRQPFHFTILTDPQLVQKTAEIPWGTSGFRHNIPVLAVAVGHLNAFSSERDRHIIYIDCGLAAMTFVYALEAQGLSTVCLNWPDVEEKEEPMMNLLQLQPFERPVMLIGIGYADPEGLAPFSQKKPLERLRRYNLE